MDAFNLIESFSEFKEFRNIDKETLMDILKETFYTVVRKKYGDNFDIIANVDKGDLEIWGHKIIVKDSDLVDGNKEIKYSDAIKIESDFEIGEEISEEIKLEHFSRREISTIRQMLFSNVLDHKREEVFKKYNEKIGDIVMVDVHQVNKQEVILFDDDYTELTLPKNEMIKSEYYRKGDTVKAVIVSVERRVNNVHIVLSRKSPLFLKKLFEHEVPEIEDGLIFIKDVVRIPGEKSKIAVESYDDKIDPIGICVGMKGNRIHGIVRELRDENIDVVNYTTNAKLYITRALNPAKISSISIDEVGKTADVYIKPEFIAVAIGKNGCNIKLATRLTGYEINLFRDSEDIMDDVDLQEFSDEIDQWIIDTLKSIGCDTARSVLSISNEDLAIRTDLEDETINEVVKILKSEFDE